MHKTLRKVIIVFIFTYNLQATNIGLSHVDPVMLMRGDVMMVWLSSDMLVLMWVG